MSVLSILSAPSTALDSLRTVVAGTPERSVSLDDALQALRNERRRLAIRVIDDYGRLRFGDLVDEIAARQTAKRPEELSSAERKRVYTPLKQGHLDKLVENGALAKDDHTDVVKPGPEFEAYVKALDNLDRLFSRPGEDEQSAVIEQVGR